MSEIDYSELPEHMRFGVHNYIEHGLEPGSFLRAVISNNLFEAIKRADRVNAEYLPLYVRFFESNAPAWCYGSLKNYTSWVALGGLSGAANKERA